MPKKLRILIVDDNVHFQNAFKYVLLDGFESRIETILCAQNGRECLDILEKNIVDVIFLDVEMPIMNGIEATKKICEQFRGIIIIALSFHEEMSYVRQMITAGARYYIIKEDVSKKQINNLFDKYFY
jgi:YesN/AraC family two-component response regulator